MPNTEISHLGTCIINLQIGNIIFDNTYEWKDIDLRFPRLCMKCKTMLKYRQALIHATIKGFTEKEFKALWKCDIVEFLCCSCFNNRNFDALDAMRHSIALD